MERTPPPTSLAAALALPRTPGRSAEVFVDGDLEVRFAARPTDGPQVPHQRDELYFVAAGTGRYRVEDEVTDGRARRPSVLRRACGARVREYLGGLLRLGAVLRPGQAIALTPTPCSGFPRHNIPFVRQTNAYPRPMVGRGNAVGAGFRPRTPRHAADRQTAVPATRGAGIATAFPVTWPAAAPALTRKRSPRLPCDPRRRLPPSWALGASGPTVRRCRRICKDL